MRAGKELPRPRCCAPSRLLLQLPCAHSLHLAGSSSLLLPLPCEKDEDRATSLAHGSVGPADHRWLRQAPAASPVPASLAAPRTPLRLLLRAARRTREKRRRPPPLWEKTTVVSCHRAAQTSAEVMAMSLARADGRSTRHLLCCLQPHQRSVRTRWTPRPAFSATK